MGNESERFYRYQQQSREGGTAFQVKYRETDLWIRAERGVEKEALEAVLNLRYLLERYIAENPEFLRSLSPLPDDPTAPALIRQMLGAARAAGVGPMAAVAGAIAQAVSTSLKPRTRAIIVENGGDCYLDTAEDTQVGIYAGPRSPFKGRIALRFPSSRFPLGICTSSGVIGHSLSFGKADALTVVSKDAALADAAATAIGNLVKTPGDITSALEKASSIPGIEGVLVLIKDKMGVWGDLELVPA
jgi:ApbE superfamily uncharacterized protein (UPF0280 family)